MQGMLAAMRQQSEGAREYIGTAKQWALRHFEYRLEAEAAYLTELLAAADEIVDDERHPRPRKLKPVPWEKAPETGTDGSKTRIKMPGSCRPKSSAEELTKYLAAAILYLYPQDRSGEQVQMKHRFLCLARPSRRSLPYSTLAFGIGLALLGVVSASGAGSSNSSAVNQGVPTSTAIDPYIMEDAYGHLDAYEAQMGAIPDVRVDETPLQHASREYSKNHFDKAVPELETILKKTPQDVRARLLLSAIYLHQNQPQKALPQLEAAADQESTPGFHPDFPNGDSDTQKLVTTETQTLLATAYLKTGQPQKAIRLARASLARTPKDPQTAFELGVTLAQAGNPSEAADAFAEASALNPKDSRAAFLAGLWYHQAGEDTKAVPALDKALKLGTTHKFEAYSALAEAAANAGNFPDAVADDTLALKIQPNDFPTLANLAAENQNLGRIQQARDFYLRALALKTGDPASRARISAYLQDLSRT